MKPTRRTLLRTVSTLTAGLAGATTVSATESPPQWDPDTVYTDGDRVGYDGVIWEAQWWTRGNEPGASEWGPWERIEDAPDDPDPEPPEGPTASIVVSDAAPEPGQTVEFDAGESAGDLTSFGWDFGDGTGATGAVVSHAFETAGEYTVELTVTDAAGATDADSVSVSVEEHASPPGDTGAIPDSVFAPYHHMNTDPTTAPAEWADLAGTNYFHLAFVLGTGDGTPAWDGNPNQAVGETSFGDEIRDLQARGGQAIISFGGATGNYLASDYDDPHALADAFESVVDEYDCPYIDIDDEAPNGSVVDLRNEALSILQDRRPDVHVGYTVRTRVTGIADTEIITNAIDNGVEIEYVNLMTMNWGWVRTSAENCIQCAEGAHDQLQEWFPDKSDAELYDMIGITPMIGVQNSGEPFYPDDAAEVRSYAEEHDIGLLSFWSIERDNPGNGLDSEHSGVDQEPFEFSENFNGFTAE
ncbi:PKD domain-containing protein [Natrinema salaciae]|uniref:Chitodextrinase n=1 Tax=Natrinema salaciae TaxID=1186196 RepID=A0A1H9NN42_9EURY|nr:PKD domain-containing protein [Natrinema salaciae]SER36793.1 Chitodextrinase [Natrinema salaciae]